MYKSSKHDGDACDSMLHIPTPILTKCLFLCRKDAQYIVEGLSEFRGSVVQGIEVISKGSYGELEG